MASACAVSASLPAHAQLFSRATVYEGATVHLGNGETIEDCNLVIQGGRIAGLGPNASAQGTATTYDVAGRVITPGLIDAWGVFGFRRPANSLDATALAADGIDLYDENAVRDAWRNGVTTVYAPAWGRLGINGVGTVVSLASDGETGAFATLVEDSGSLHVSLHGNAGPIARLEVIAEIEERMAAAKEYRESLDIYAVELDEYEEELKTRADERKKKEEEEDSKDDDAETGNNSDGEPSSGSAENEEGEKNDTKNGDDGEEEEGPEKPEEPRPNRVAEVLLEAIDHELTVRIHAERAEDILTAIELAERFGLDTVLEGGAEAHLVARQLADAEIPVILGPEPGSDADDGLRRGRLGANASSLSDAGVEWAVGTGATPGAQRFVLLTASGVTDGTDPIHLVTGRAAGVLGIDGGRLTPGTTASFVVWDGDPVAGARVEEVYIDGTAVYRRPGIQRGNN
ncbi:MAG: hypothetical protein AAGG07_01850 [Planctomycetota bacterium]